MSRLIDAEPLEKRSPKLKALIKEQPTVYPFNEIEAPPTGQVNISPKGAVIMNREMYGTFKEIARESGKWEGGIWEVSVKELNKGQEEAL